MAVISIIAGVLAWILGIGVFAARPGNSQNRRFGALMAIEGVFLLTFFGVTQFVDDPRWAAPLVSVSMIALLCLPWFYLSFIGTVEAKAAAPFRGIRGFLTLILGIASVGYLHFGVLAKGQRTIQEFDEGLVRWGYEYALDGASIMPFVAVIAGVLLTGLVGLYGLIVALQAWSQAPYDSPSRRRNGLLAIAFGIRDTSLLLAFLILPLLNLAFPDLQSLDDAAFLFFLPPIADLIFIPLVAYGVIRAEVFGIELTVKRNIPRAVFVGALVAGFVIVNEIVENLLTQQAGVIAGISTAVVLAFAFRPIERLGFRLANVALPEVEANAVYFDARKREVYRDTFESMLRDGRIDAQEQVILEKLRARLEIPDDVVAQIEGEIMPVMSGPPG